MDVVLLNIDLKKANDKLNEIFKTIFTYEGV
jgi:hypothetical protein